MVSSPALEHIVTRSGCGFDLRPVCPDDAAALAAFFTHITPDDLRFRFLSGVTDIGEQRLAAMTHVDHRQTENFIAFAHGEPRIIASAMVACDPEGKRAEVAIAVHADFKGHGVGWEMLAHAARYAEAMGVEVIESIEARDNISAIALERDMGFTASAYPGDPTLILLQRQLGQLGQPA